MNSLLKKLKGYQKAPRARFLLLKRGQLTQEEFLLYELSIDVTDWDRKHETYGTFKATNQEFAEILGWKSDTSVLRHKKSLIKKGLFIVTEDNRLIAKGFEKWQLRKYNPSENENKTAKIQTNPAKIENQTAEIEEARTQEGDYSLVSFKGNLSLSKDIVDETLSDEELNRIISEIDTQKPLLTVSQGAIYVN